MGRLDGKVAVITGASGGIGRACAEAMAREGARVVLSDLPGAGVDRAAAAIKEAGGTAVHHEGDVSEESHVVAMIGTAADNFGRLDILDNNAAATDLQLVMQDSNVVETPVEVWDRVMAVNLRGAMLTCKHAIPLMIKGGGGSIINTSSGESLMGDIRMCAYGTSKAALNGLTRYVATAFGKEGVRCNAIAPGLVRTAKLAEVVPPVLIDIYQQNHLTSRVGETADIANLVVFLASDESAFITGQVIPIDGGYTSHLPHYAQFRTLREVTEGGSP